MFEQYIINEYLRGLAVLVVFFFVIRVALFFFQKTFLKISQKTKSDLDDKLIEKTSFPLTVIAFLIVLNISIGEISLEETTMNIISTVIWSVLVLTIAHLFYSLLDLILIRGVKRITRKTKSRIDDSLISLFQSVFRIAMVSIAVLYILDLWGIQIGPLLAGLGIAGLAVALALQPILSNIFSGASMILDQSVRVGDLVYLESQSIKGKIEKVGLRSTRIRTFDNEQIIIPNTRLADSIIQNVALPEPKSRVVVPFGVAYGSDVKRVKEIVLNEIKKIKGISDEPHPFIRFMEMADSSLNFNLYFHVDTFEDRADAIDEANTKIYDALNKAKIEIPFPQRDVHMKK